MKNTQFENLPPNTIKEVAKRTNLSTTLVSLVLNGKLLRSPNKAIILQTAAEYVKEYKAVIREAETALIEAINA